MDKISTSRFNTAPTITKGRSRFDLSFPIRTTCNTGDFVLLNAEFVHPGETFTVKNSNFIRLETSLHQTMDNAYYETGHFFVPLRIIWDDVDKFFGYNEDPWAADEVAIPQIVIDSDVQPQSILNHLGIPSGSYNSDQKLSISALPIRAYFEIWNQFFRDQNYDTIIAYSKDSNDYSLSEHATDGFAFNDSYVSLNYYSLTDTAHEILRVNRYHDIFSSVLPAPQKGSPVGLSFAGQAPVFGSGNSLQIVSTGDGVNFAYGYFGLDDAENSADKSVGVIGTGGDLGFEELSNLTSVQLATKKQMEDLGGVQNPKPFAYADLSDVSPFTINQLRLAIAAQAIKERDARAGTRMIEQLYSIWGVRANSLELDRPEFLGGKRIPITMMEVLQTSETGTTVLGSDAGHSKTYGDEDGFTKSFTEYGYIISVCYLRTARSYSQGINKKLFMKNRFDVYDPMLDNIGEVDVKQKELMALGLDEDELNAPIGYNEPWYHLKEGLAHDSGFFQAGITGTLDSWHYGDSYESGEKVIPNAGWLKETPNQVDRTIAVQSSTGHQWAINVGYECYATRQMSRYNIPNTFGFGSK